MNISSTGSIKVVCLNALKNAIVPGDLMMCPLFHYQSASHHRFTGMFAQLGDWAVCFPGNVIKQFQGMPAHGIAE